MDYDVPAEQTLTEYTSVTALSIAESDKIINLAENMAVLTPDRLN